MDIENANKAIAYLERSIPALDAAVKARAALSDLCFAFAELRALKERTDKLVGQIGAIEKRLADETIPAYMDATSTESPYNHVTGQFKKTTRVSASILADRKTAAWAWLRGAGLGAIIIETVNAQTLGATARELIEKGRELPSDLFKTNTNTYVAFVPRKEK